MECSSFQEKSWGSMARKMCNTGQLHAAVEACIEINNRSVLSTWYLVLSVLVKTLDAVDSRYHRLTYPKK